MGELPAVVETISTRPVVADTVVGRVQLESDDSAPLGRMPFFIDFVK
jgi:hypothetical protein